MIILSYCMAYISIGVLVLIGGLMVDRLKKGKKINNEDITSELVVGTLLLWPVVIVLLIGMGLRKLLLAIVNIGA